MRMQERTGELYVQWEKKKRNPLCLSESRDCIFEDKIICWEFVNLRICKNLLRITKDWTWWARQTENPPGHREQRTRLRMHSNPFTSLKHIFLGVSSFTGTLLQKRAPLSFSRTKFQIVFPIGATYHSQLCLETLKTWRIMLLLWIFSYCPAFAFGKTLTRSALSLRNFMTFQGWAPGFSCSEDKAC